MPMAQPRGLQNGLEKVSKFMMLALLAIMVILAVNSVMLNGAMRGAPQCEFNGHYGDSQNDQEK